MSTRRQLASWHVGDTPRPDHSREGQDRAAARRYFMERQAAPGYRPGSDACWNMTPLDVPCLGILGHDGPCGELNR